MGITATGIKYIYIKNKGIFDWQNGEKISIKYLLDDIQRTYRPDFILNNKYIIEIKPKKLRGSKIVICKEIAAKEYCLKNNLKYKLFDIEILSKDKLIELYNKKEIIFIPRYEIKFKETKRILDFITYNFYTGNYKI